MPAKKSTGNPDYSALLRDPRWQKKRLEIMQARGFKCEDCGDEKSELNVHHCYYTKDAKPWDYPDECYRVMCEKCHREWHDAKERLNQAMAGMSVKTLENIADIALCGSSEQVGYAAGIMSLSTSVDLLKFASDIAWSEVESFTKGMEAGRKEKK